jgi:hypothetical protein
MFEILFPIPFLVIGVAATFFHERAAEWFCRAGRALWRRTTFGLTDMAPFYQEEQAKRVFRLLGPLFLCGGLFATWMTVQSLSGPNTWAAMRQARSYVEAKHAASGGGWKFSASSKSDDTVEVTYRYGTAHGRLLATWKTNHYEFTELPEASTGQR